MAATDSTIQASGGDYTTIASWHSAVPTSPSGQQRGLLAAEAFVHTGDIRLNGKSPSSGNEVILTTQTGASFLDQATFVGYYNTSYARITASSNSVTILDVDDDYTWVEKVQIYNSSTATSGDSCIRIGRPNAHIKNSIVRATMDCSEGLIWLEIQNARAINCLVQSEHSGAGAENIIGLDGDCDVVNCTVVIPDNITDTNGIAFRRWSGLPYLYNCCCFGVDNDVNTNNFSSSSDYNGGDTDGVSTPLPGSNSIFSLTYADQFTNDETDFTLKSGNDLAGAGNKETTLAPEDALGVTRPTACAIGWLEEIVTTQDLTPSLFTETNIFYAATVAAGGVTVSPSLFTNANVFYSPVVSTSNNIAPSRFDEVNIFYAPSIGVGAVTLSPSRFDETNIFYAPSVGVGAVNLAPSRFDETNIFYSPTITQDGGEQFLVPDLFQETNIFYASVVAAGVATIAPSLFQETNIFYSATITQSGGTQNLEPSLFQETNVFYSHTITGGEQTAEETFSGGYPITYKPLKKRRRVKTGKELAAEALKRMEGVAQLPNNLPRSVRTAQVIELEEEIIELKDINDEELRDIIAIASMMD